jgi:hypothetical protein
MRDRVTMLDTWLATRHFGASFASGRDAMLQGGNTGRQQDSLGHEANKLEIVMDQFGVGIKGEKRTASLIKDISFCMDYPTAKVVYSVGQLPLETCRIPATFDGAGCEESVGI